VLNLKSVNLLPVIFDLLRLYLAFTPVRFSVWLGFLSPAAHLSDIGVKVLSYFINFHVDNQ